MIYLEDEETITAVYYGDDLYKSIPIDFIVMEDEELLDTVYKNKQKRIKEYEELKKQREEQKREEERKKEYEMYLKLKQKYEN
jgi:hypothetical protein